MEYLKEGETPTVNVHSTRDNLPKLRLTSFDSDPLRWPDWSSMFKSIVHERTGPFPSH